jgi:ferredoxin
MPKKVLTKKKSLGEYVVDSTVCIACETCVEIAPGNFAMKKKTAYVERQPSTAGERAACKEAMTACPVDAISNG